MPLKSPDTSHTTRTFLSSQYMYMCPYDVAFIYSIRHVRSDRDETIKLLLAYSVHIIDNRLARQRVNLQSTTSQLTIHETVRLPVALNLSSTYITRTRPGLVSSQVKELKHERIASLQGTRDEAHGRVHMHIDLTCVSRA